MYALLETIIPIFKKNVAPFQNGGEITDFYFALFRFWPKFEKPLSQRNFSMKFGSKEENMNRFTLLKQHFEKKKIFSFKMAAKQFLDIAQ